MKQITTPASVMRKPATKPANGKPGNAKAADAAPSAHAFSPSAEEVALRAYLNYENHGAADGHDVDDWHAAEAALRAEHGLDQT